MSTLSKRSKTWMAAVVVVVAALAVAGCGDSDEKNESSPSTTERETPTTTASTTTSETIDFAEVFAPISGYQLTELPPSVLDEARRQYQSEVSGNALAKQAVKELNGRAVSKDGEGVAIVLGMAFDPEVSSLPGFQDGFVQGAAGDDSEPVTLSGEDAAAFTQADGTEGVVFAKGQLGLLVIGDGASSSQLQDIMSQLIGNYV